MVLSAKRRSWPFLGFLLLAAGWVLPAHGESERLARCETDFVVVTPENPDCGFSLSHTGTLSENAEALAKPLIASYEDDGTTQKPIAAGQVVLFPPSPSDRFRILQACDGTGSSALCWSVFVLDQEKGRLRKTSAGHYGPERWQSWSPEGRYVVLLDKDEGAAWLHVINAETAKARTFPPFDSGENWTIEPKSLNWNAPRSFMVNVKTCETCRTVEKTIHF